MDFKELYILNLSNNALSGEIPSSIGNLRQLESLDLSQNALSGGIPMQIASLSFLSYLNLSFNHLVGKIPTGTQLQSFSASSFEGNDGLYGPPLTENPHGKRPGVLLQRECERLLQIPLHFYPKLQGKAIFGVLEPTPTSWGFKFQIAMAAQLIHDSVVMECLEGVWETLEGNERLDLEEILNQGFGTNIKSIYFKTPNLYGGVMLILDSSCLVWIWSTLKMRMRSPLKARACSPLQARMCSPLMVRTYSPLKLANTILIAMMNMSTTMVDSHTCTTTSLGCARVQKVR
ncbi:hypothetical protein JHK85_006787 [Glycine max]|nr:hypothetical protein JHK85_006787 [Glycine max]